METMSNKKVYEQVFAQIQEKMESLDPSQWVMPWNALEAGCPMSLSSGKQYNGGNSLVLAILAHLNGFESRTWATFNQVKKAGGKVKKGSKSSIAYFFKQCVKEEIDDSGKKVKSYFPIARSFRVFNLNQVEGVKDPFVIKEERGTDFDPVAEAEKIIAGYKDGPKVDHGGGRAYYSPVEGYYGTMFHELCHSTGHEKRLNRDTLAKVNLFGSHDYSKEELVAEIGASMLQSVSGIFSDNEVRNSAAYIKGWWSKLKSEPSMLFQASSKAQKAADYILGKGDAK